MAIHALLVNKLVVTIVSNDISRKVYSSLSTTQKLATYM